jgi:hypothetical protein
MLRFHRALEATAKERAELRARLDAALMTPWPPQTTIHTPLSLQNPIAGMPGWTLRPPDGQATTSGTAT